MQELKRLIKDAGLTQSDISLALNIKSLSTINLKLNGKAEFSTKEATILKNMINEKLNSNYSLEDLFSNHEN
jgi:transcriptional regulator with XRE-family HTH domain